MYDKYCSSLSPELFRTIASEFKINEENLIEMNLDAIRVVLEDKYDSVQITAQRSTDDYDIWNYDRIVRIYSDFMEEYRLLLD